MKEYKFINKQRTKVLRELDANPFVLGGRVGQADEQGEDLPSEVVFLIWDSPEESAMLALEMQQSAVVTGVVGAMQK